MIEIDRARRLSGSDHFAELEFHFFCESESRQGFDFFRNQKFIEHQALRRAKLPSFRVYDLRHTYASLLIAQGESLAYVRDQMGHHSIKVTVDTYGHLVPGGNKAAVDRLDEPSAASIRNPDATSTAAAELEVR